MRRIASVVAKSCIVRHVTTCGYLSVKYIKFDLDIHFMIYGERHFSFNCDAYFLQRVRTHVRMYAPVSRRYSRLLTTAGQPWFGAVSWCRIHASRWSRERRLVSTPIPSQPCKVATPPIQKLSTLKFKNNSLLLMPRGRRGLAAGYLTPDTSTTGDSRANGQLRRWCFNFCN